MKKLFIGLGVASAVLFGATAIPSQTLTPAYAEEPTVVEPETPPVEPTEPTIPVEPEVPAEPTPEVPEQTFDVEAWLGHFFSPETVALIVTWATYIATFIPLIVSKIRDRKKVQYTAKEVGDTVLKELSKVVSTEVMDQIQNIAPKIISSMDSFKEVLKIFAKVLCLAQENTPESRLAIIELISQIGVIDATVTEESKKIVEEQIQENEIKKQETNEKLDEIINEKDDGTSV